MQSLEYPYRRQMGWMEVDIYNIDNDTEVKIESYIDDQATNKWRQMTSVTDDGSWYASSSDREFYSIIAASPKITLSQTQVLLRHLDQIG